jgi:hypothetical protein
MSAVFDVGLLGAGVNGHCIGEYAHELQPTGFGEGGVFHAIEESAAAVSRVDDGLTAFGHGAGFIAFRPPTAASP